MVERHNIGRQREAFDKKWDEMDKDLRSKFNLMFVFAILLSIVMTAAICVGVYLAVKNWG